MCLKRLKKSRLFTRGLLKASRRKKTSMKYLDESYLFTSSQLSSSIFLSVTKYLDESYLFTS